MSKPFLTLIADTYPANQTINLSDLTSKTGTYDPLSGTNQSDWCINIFSSSDHSVVNNPRFNKDGLFQCNVQRFGSGASFTTNNLASATWTWAQTQEVQATNPSSAGQGGVGCDVTGPDAGVEFPGPLAPSNLLKEMHLFGKTINGVFQVEAVLSDGSVTVAPLVLPSNAFFGAKINFCGQAPDSTLNVKIRRTDSGGTATVFPQVAYILYPVPAKLPRRFARRLAAR